MSTPAQHTAGRLPSAHHLPLLDLTADEVDALTAAAAAWAEIASVPILRSALDKLTTR